MSRSVFGEVLFELHTDRASAIPLHLNLPIQQANYIVQAALTPSELGSVRLENHCCHVGELPQPARPPARATCYGYLNRNNDTLHVRAAGTRQWLHEHEALLHEAVAFFD